MNVFDSYTRSVLEKLNEMKVEYLVTGGYAVNYYGYRRTTGDIDLWIKPDNTVNKARIIEAFRKLEVPEKNLKALEQLDFSLPIVFVDGEEPYRIDFMSFISGVTFAEAWTKKTIAHLDGMDIPFIHFDDLLLSKISTGRAKDAIDIDMLQKIKQIKKEL